MRALVAEDDTRLADLLAESLAEAGWQVDVVHDGRSAYDRLLTDTGYDVALLDWMLPGRDGVSVARQLRSLGLTTPILMLTARGDVRDRIEGLDAGADDYLPKPFDLDELLARLRALYRRNSVTGAAPVQVGDLVVDPVARRVVRRGQEITLSAREFDILYLMASRAGQVVTRLTILDEVWDGETDLRSNVIDVHLAAIRAKIDRPFDTQTITTLRGVGYRLDPTPAAG
ncbi:response regulator transcription factor [Nocardioides sp. WV_118_6]|uniref:response regulator transcription factor n=1 Tax=Pimelobacter sp. 30-1 TaxID=2004991 RepID=UPI001C05CCE1|nr:response regulator transcription factor [Pimelobacter sp. 30-1]MBU2695532.1 DNA-binding response regulator [Pimelobacter sp. 30-1]